MTIRRAMLVLSILACCAPGTVASAQETWLCQIYQTQQYGALRPTHVLNAKSVLLGRTVKAWTYTDDAFVGGHAEVVRANALVRTFAAAQMTEENDGEKTVYPIRWDGDFWCRDEELSGKEVCYSLVVASLDRSKGTQVIEVTKVQPPRDMCHVAISARIDGLDIAQLGAPAAESGRRRGQ